MSYLNFKKGSQLFCILMLLVGVSCTNQKKIAPEELEGYWEIDFISQHGETFKSSSAAPLYDYYAVEQMSGFYKKVAPSFRGTFETSEDVTAFKIEMTKAGYFLHFKTPWDEWEKKIIQLDSQKLILEHEKRTFHYKRPRLINFLP